MKISKKVLIKKVKKIKLLLIDTDGVMTKNFIVWSNNDVGKKKFFESKLFCVHDGSACWVAHEADLKIVLVSGRDSESVSRRAKKIKIEEVYLGRINKLIILKKLINKYGLKNHEIAYIGDDFLDIPILKKVGVAFTVKDAVEEVKEIADYIADKNGGEGAVGEIIRLVLKSQNKWNEAMKNVIKKSYNK